MKKLAVIVFLSVLLLVLLIALTFFFIDLGGHRGFVYDVYQGGRKCGSVRVDRYITEGKVVYKENAEFTSTLGYQAVSEKLFLNKRDMMPLKFVQEATGARGGVRLYTLIQNGETTDILYVDHPQYLALKGFETGSSTMVFSPDDVMLYMPVMERYNFWKKGTQYFEIMVPSDEPLPPMRDKAGVRYMGDEYVPVLGRRVEAESFLVTSGGLPGARVSLSKYGHNVLILEIDKLGKRFVLSGRIESPAKRIAPLVEKIRSLTGTLKKVKSAETEPVQAPDKRKEAAQSGKEVFFESGNLILSGRMWVPERDSPGPAVLIVPEEGVMTMGERYLVRSLAESLSGAGFVSLVFDSPGQGKSHGNFHGLDDEKKAQNIKDAAAYLEKHPLVAKGAVNLLGHGHGAYLALKAGCTLPEAPSCILLNMPLSPPKRDMYRDMSGETVRSILARRSLGPFEEGFTRTVAEKVQAHAEEVVASSDDFLFFLGTRMPSREYRQFLNRDPYSEALSFERPLLLIFGKDDGDFSQQRADELKRALAGRNKKDRVAVFRNLGPYIGELKEEDASVVFVVNKDVLDLVNRWVAENGMPAETVEIEGPDALQDVSGQ